MSESTADIQHSRALKSLLGKGLAATATGALFLAAPHFLASHLRPFGAIESLTSGIQVCGLILLLIGLVTLGVHFSVRTRMSKRSRLRRSGGLSERMNYVTRGAPLSPTHGFPVNPESGRNPGRSWHAPSS